MTAKATGPLRILGSMATRGLLSELAASWHEGAEAESAGGVAIGHRIRAGESPDVVVLADRALRTLATEGLLVPGSIVPVAVSAIAVAVRLGDTLPDLADEDAVRRALLAGRTGYSTGPSGDHLLHLIERWGIRATLGDHLVQAPPGIPVGHLLAEGTVDLAVQQRSELMNLAGITIAGPLPPPIASDTVFAAAIPAAAGNAASAARFIAHLASPATAEAKTRHGLSYQSA